VKALTIFKLLSGVGIVVLIVGIIIAAVPFKEEMTPTEHAVQISNWTVSWYYAPVKPSEEFFAGVFIGNSTFEPFFAKTYPAYSEVFGGLVEQVGFIAKTYIEVPIDGYVRFSVSGGDGTCIKFYAPNPNPNHTHVIPMPMPHPRTVSHSHIGIKPFK
jgi:hypothetical protein